MTNQKYVVLRDFSKIPTGDPFAYTGGFSLASLVPPEPKMEVEYLKPVPLGRPLKVVGHEHEVTGRQHINLAEIMNDQGEVLARGTAIFIAVDVTRMFARLSKSSNQATSLK